MSSIELISPHATSAMYFAPVYGHLYDAVKSSPGQKKVHEVFAKLILIGRTIGVPLERRPDSLRMQDSQPVVKAAEKISKSPLQGQLKSIDPTAPFTTLCHERLVRIHHGVETIFAESGSKAAPELAAAYLHFHRRNAFPLMSGQARIGAKLLLESWGQDSTGITRIARQGTYSNWLGVVGRIHERLQSTWPAAISLLQVNEYLEHQSTTELM
jgi:hypothetical protein